MSERLTGEEAIQILIENPELMQKVWDSFNNKNTIVNDKGFTVEELEILIDRLDTYTPSPYFEQVDDGWIFHSTYFPPFPYMDSNVIVVVDK